MAHPLNSCWRVNFAGTSKVRAAWSRFCRRLCRITPSWRICTYSSPCYTDATPTAASAIYRHQQQQLRRQRPRAYLASRRIAGSWHAVAPSCGLNAKSCLAKVYNVYTNTTYLLAVTRFPHRGSRKFSGRAAQIHRIIQTSVELTNPETINLKQWRNDCFVSNISKFLFLRISALVLLWDIFDCVPWVCFRT